MRPVFFIFAFLFAFGAQARAEEGRLRQSTELVITGKETKEQIMGLHDAGYKLNAWDTEGNATVFMSAAAKNSAKVVEELIEEGGDFHLKNPNGWTALSFAAAFNPDPDVIRVFIKKGADFKAKDAQGMTPLMLAAGFNKSPEVIKVLLDAGAEAGEKRSDGVTALILAVENKAPVETVRSLIAAGEDVDQEYQGRNLLYNALLMDTSPEIIAFLITAGANVHARDLKFRRTVLMEAALQSTAEVVKLLLERGASAMMTDERGRSAIFYAVQNKKYGKDIVPLLVENGADLEALDNDGFNPYMTALYFGNRDTAEAVWNAGGNLSRKFLDAGVSTLMWTALFGKERAVLDDLINPRSLEERDKDGNTALALVAAQGKDYNVLQILADGGADVNAVNKFGQTPLMLAALYAKNANMILTLLNANASPYLQDANGATAFDYAKKNKNPQIAETLKNYAE